MTSEYFSFDKRKVIQALRYHFIGRREIRILLILVNVFALLAAALFYFKKVSPLAFLIASFLWILLMLNFWFILPYMVYRRSATFRDRFKAVMDANGMELSNERGSNQWKWETFASFAESPNFFHLYFNERSFFILPKEAFNSDQISEIRGLLREKIKRRSN